MLWKIRCIIVWLFRMLAIAAVAAWLAMLTVVLFRTPLGWTFKDFAQLTAFSLVTPFFIYACVMIVGRILSWTAPFSPLPRFNDRTGPSTPVFPK